MHQTQDQGLVPRKCVCFPDARSEDQICHCVCQGERPDEALIPPDTPQDVIELMKTCWKEDPRHRPTFKGRGLEAVLPTHVRRKMLKDVVMSLRGDCVITMQKCHCIKSQQKMNCILLLLIHYNSYL